MGVDLKHADWCSSLGVSTRRGRTNKPSLVSSSRFLHCSGDTIWGIVMQIRRGDRQSMTTILRQLHWLPVRKRIEYKLLVLVHMALYDGTPEYLAALLLQHAPRRSLRSAGGLLLEVPKVNLERFGEHESRPQRDTLHY